MAGAIGLLTSPAGYGIAVWVLAIVFVWSGLAKLRRPALAAMAITDFGVLRKIRPWLGTALGGAELLLALSLIVGVLPIVFLPATAGLLWLFVLLIARSLWSGKEFSCFCFGDADARISGVTLLRTIALALLASALAVAPLPYASLGQSYLLQALCAVALVGTIALGGQVPKLLRWNRDPYNLGNMEVDGRVVGSSLREDVAVVMPDGERAYLLLISASCEPCRELVAELDGHHFEQSVVALVPGRQEQASELAALLPPGIRVVFDPEATHLAESLDLESTPFAIEVEGGTVTSKVHLFGGASALLEFVESASARAENGSFVEISEKEAIEGR